jgi:hypothetical protein
LKKTVNTNITRGIRTANITLIKKKRGSVMDIKRLLFGKYN